jgi:hypothetical protein
MFTRSVGSHSATLPLPFVISLWMSIRYCLFLLIAEHRYYAPIFVGVVYPVMNWKPLPISSSRNIISVSLYCMKSVNICCFVSECCPLIFSVAILQVQSVLLCYVFMISLPMCLACVVFSSRLYFCFLGSDLLASSEYSSLWFSLR